MKALRSLLALVFVLLLALMLAAPASATKPVVETYDWELDYPLDPQPCPDIVIWDHEFVTVNFTTHFDKQGVPVMVIGHGTGTDNFYNKADPDISLSGHFVHNVKYDLIAGTEYHSGVPYHLTVPGYGTVLVEAGRWFADGRVVGKHSFSDSQDMAQFCWLMAGN